VQQSIKDALNCCIEQSWKVYRFKSESLVHSVSAFSPPHPS
jgi:hypothetical protein